MTQLLTYPDIDPQQWQALIDRSSYATWFQTKEAYDFYASNSKEMTPFAVAIQRTNKLVAVCVGYITQAKNKLVQCLTCRAIIIGGPVIDEDATAEEIAALLTAVKNQSILNPSLKGRTLDTTKQSPFPSGRAGVGLPIYIETRNFHDYSCWKEVFQNSGFQYQPHLNFHVDTTSVDLVESRLGKNRKRDIKTSIRDGATVIEHPTIEQVRTYYAMLKHLYTTKIKTPLFSWDFFEKLYAHPNGRFILVELNGEIIGGTVCVELPERCLYEWFVCGRDGEWKSIFPSSLATYAGIRYAAEHGCSRFDMMGAGKPDEAYGVRDFKARFGGEQVEHGRYLCIRKPLLYQIGKLGVKLLKKR